MSIRGKAAIAGISEIPTRRVYPGRSMLGLCAEAARLAIEDAGLRKEDIDGLITEGGDVFPDTMGEYLGIRTSFATGVSMHGASGTTAVAVAAEAIAAGSCSAALIVMGAAREANQPFGRGGPPTASIRSEFEAIYGPAAAANNGYGLLYQRHMYEFGTKPEQMAKLAVAERFNALTNPNAVFQGQPITIQDVLNSRYVNAPLRILECVMPCAGAAACVVTSLDRAKTLPNRPAVILGTGIGQGTAAIWQNEMMTTSPVKVSAPKAFAMAGYGPKDMDYVEFYD